MGTEDTSLDFFSPTELGGLPLVRLDFSCNRVSRLPLSFCRLRHLQVLLLDSNPLQSPPAQVGHRPVGGVGSQQPALP